VTRRLVGALLAGEPDTLERPSRRLALGLFAGLLVATLILAAVGVYGFLSPSGPRLRDGDLVIMRDTGARFVLAGGALHPVPNWTSALLIAGTPRPAVRRVSREALAGYPPGVPVGIPDAPDPPPERGALVGLPWTVCSVPGPDAPTTQVLVGPEPAGTPAPADPTMLVYAGPGPTPGGEWHLLWQGRRHRIPDDRTRAALGLAGASGVRVAPQLLAAVPAGPDLAAPPIPQPGLPTGLPRLAADHADLVMVCAARRGDEPADRMSTVSGYRLADARRLAIPAGTSAATVDRAGNRTADRVRVPPGAGTLVRASPAGGTFLVTDQGIRYALQGSAAVDALGYGGADPVAVPAAMLDLVPAGPALDPAVARSFDGPRGGR
jgi:Type VII secretion system ESX-1, transport TM domain B